jgi:hypothetical protein
MSHWTVFPPILPQGDAGATPNRLTHRTNTNKLVPELLA